MTTTYLLAILLVTDSSRGHQCVFHYPKNPQRRDEAPELTKDDQDLEEVIGEDQLETDVITWPYAPSEDIDRRSLISRVEQDIEEAEAAKQRYAQDPNDGNESYEVRTVFGFTKDVLADALSPKSNTTEKFQLSIDDLTFVGQPVFLKRAHKIKDENQGNEGNMEASPEHDESIVDDHGYEMERNGMEGETKLVGEATNTKQHHLSLFHLVFVLEPPELELNRQVDSIYEHVITKLTSALRYEQLRCAYVGREASLIASIKDEANVSGEHLLVIRTWPRKTLADKTTHDSFDFAGMSFDGTMDEILAKSTLAQTIAEVYHAISRGVTARVMVNDYIDLSLQIPPLAPSLFFSPLDSERDSYEYAHYPVIAPYHTLLLLEDPLEILKTLPLDASPTLVELVQIITPIQR